MALQSEQVGHSSLVGGGEITLHSHAGSGGGVPVKAGTIVTDGSGITSVVFNSNFSDVNYAIILTAQDPGDATICMYFNKAVIGFDVMTLDDGGRVESGVTVDWLAIPYSNP